MRRVTSLVAAAAIAATVSAPAVAGPSSPSGPGEAPPDDRDVRFATFNASLNRNEAGALRSDLQAVADGETVDQVQAVLDIIERNDADVLLVNEFDFDPVAAELFADLTDYDHHFTAPSNTGIASGHDLNNDGVVGGPDDAYGFGFFEGQYGMLVLSRLPLTDVRTFQQVRWADMPGALLPELDGQPWFTDEELADVRLSSKSHWDVSIDVPGRHDVHLLASHPTPPVFDGAEDRNGRRNHDEIRFWVDYVTPGPTSDWIIDDAGDRGGLAPGERFVVAGDLNSDPVDGDSLPGAATQLLDHPLVNTSLTPTSEGAVEQTMLQGSNNVLETAQYDTADFGEAEFNGPGNLRVDYVLPSKHLRMLDAGVDWPLSDDPDFAQVGVFPFPSSDHRLVWTDLS